MLRESARQVFAEAGFHRATTREIASRSGVSETLLFRYFGDKSGIFEEVVAGPFQDLAREFSRTVYTQRFSVANFDTFVGEAYSLALANRELLKAYLHYAMTPDGQSDGLGAFDDYFADATVKLDAQYEHLGRGPDLDLAIAVRLGFSMIITSVVAAPWLFDGVDPEHVKATLRTMIFRSFAPATNIDD